MKTVARLAVAAFLAAGIAVAARGNATISSPGEWKRYEGYAVMVETGPFGAPAVRREVFLLSRVFHGRIPTPEIVAISLQTAAGVPSAAYRLQIHDGTKTPVSLEPVALRLDSRQQAFRLQSEAAPMEIGPIVENAAKERAADAANINNTESRPEIKNTGEPPFVILRIPATSGSVVLPYIQPIFDNGEPSNSAGGWMLQMGTADPRPRAMKQSARKSDSGEWMVDLRNDGGPRLIVNLQLSPKYPIPLWGQILDAERNEHTRFRIIAHSPTLAKSLTFGRVQVVGDPLLINPELLENAESVWESAFHDLTAREMAGEITKDLGLLKIDGRSSPADGEFVPFSYELFAVGPSVSSGEKIKSNATKSGIAPRGAVGTFFVGRYEDPASRTRYEAWLVPGADERAQETDAPNPSGESVGRLLLRLVLGNGSNGLLAERGIQLRLDPDWYKLASTRASSEPRMGIVTNPKSKNKKKDAPAASRAPRGSDAILLRKEHDYSPVALIFYRMSDDLRGPVPFVTSKLESAGSSSVVRRSLLERAKDFFLSGGFTAFTTKKGASFLLTRSQEDGTVVDRVNEHGCALELLEEKDLPEEPWKLDLDPRNGKNNIWGTAVSLAIGRNKYGDSRIPRDGIVRRTDGEELVAYESWEIDRPWWSEAIAAYPRQGVGVRFRPLVHAKLNDPNANDNNPAEDDYLPFEPPPPPPQPRGNPKTPRPPTNNPKPKPKPQPEPGKTPAPPPPTPTSPKTGG